MKKKSAVRNTPGRWYVGIGEKYCFHACNRVAICYKTRDGEATLAEVWPADGDQDIADGHLIAAAPALRRQLGKAYRELRNQGVDIYCKEMRDIRKALKRAKGEAC